MERSGVPEGGMKVGDLRQIDLPDLGHSLLLRLKDEHWLDVEVFEVFFVEAGEVMWRGKGCDYNSPVGSLDDAEVRFRGFVKWDHCSNWNLEGIHFCEAADAVQFSKLIQAIYVIAEEVIPAWDLT